VTPFSISAQDADLVRQPFYAYLLPENMWIEPPHVPEEAILLGHITIADPGAPGGKPRIARLSVTIPMVPPGAYSVALCNRPCTATYVGDLIGGGIYVAASAEQADTMAMIDQAETRLTEWIGELEGRLTGDASDIRRLSLSRHQVSMDAVRDLEARLGELEMKINARLDRLEERLASPAGISRSAGLAALLVLAVGSVAIVARRRWRLSSSRGERSGPPAESHTLEPLLTIDPGPSLSPGDRSGRRHRERAPA
jgi:hypothetical protein